MSLSAWWEGVTGATICSQSWVFKAPARSRLLFTRVEQTSKLKVAHGSAPAWYESATAGEKKKDDFPWEVAALCSIDEASLGLCPGLGTPLEESLSVVGAECVKFGGSMMVHFAI